MKKIALFLLITTFLYSCMTTKKTDSKLLILSNGTIEIGLLPDAGAALVCASLVGKPNILNSDSTLWNETPEQRASLDPKAPFRSYNGHITWLSPQTEWWINQDSFPELKAAKSVWPPDPILTLAPYRIISQTASEITLESPRSPYSQIQFTKTFRIDGNKVYLTTQAKNIGTDSVSWGLWHNTRMNGWDAVFAQTDSATVLREIEYIAQGEIQKPGMSWKDGFHAFNSLTPEGEQAMYRAKAFLNVENPLIAGNHENQWLIIRSNALDNSKIHPNQARVEIYIENSNSPKTDLQELEMQFEYQQIAPGASIEASETWEILPGTGLTDKVELLEELKRILK
jgi:hypothetical protein